MKLDQTQLVTGDRVGIQRCGSWKSRYSLTTVKSVTNTGMVTVENGDRFTKDGRLVGGSKYHGTYLVPAVQAEDAIEADRKSHETNAKWNGLESELAAIVRNHKNGYGDVSPITQEEKDRLIALINAM